MGWWPCCCLPLVSGCTNCAGSMPQYVRLTPSGSLSNSSCTTCGDVSSTFVLKRNVGFGSECIYNANTCYCGSRTLDEARFEYLNSAGTYFGKLTLRVSPYDTAVYLGNLGASAPDCTAQRTLTYSAADSSIGAGCTGYNGISWTVQGVSGPEDYLEHCTHCSQWTTPNLMDLTISGLAAASPVRCTACASFDGTYTNIGRNTASSCCIYQDVTSYTNSGCTLQPIVITITSGTVTVTFTIAVNIGGLPYVTDATFQTAFAGTCQFSSLSVPFLGQSVGLGAFGHACDASGATVSISAV